MSDALSLCGAIEAGGTKFMCAVGTGPESIHAFARIPTTTPDETLHRVHLFFDEHGQDITSVGIGAFGPIDLRAERSTYGYLLDTPKPDWSHVNLVGRIEQALQVPVAIDTDVNAAAIGEDRWGAGRDVNSLLYLTVGTGIGGGYIVNGRCLHGLLHPEMGHIAVPQHPDDDFDGVCPYHSDCLEGLASGTALEARWGASPETFHEDHPAWDIQAHYLAHACASFIYTLSPERIVLGGGVMNQDHLFPRVRERLLKQLGDYPLLSVLSENNIDQYVVPPTLGPDAGMLGALTLAQDLTSPADADCYASL